MVEGAVPPSAGRRPAGPRVSRGTIPEARRPGSRCRRTPGPGSDSTTCTPSAARLDRTLSVSLADPSAGREQHASRWLLEQAAELNGTRVTASELQRMGDKDWLTVVPSAESALLDWMKLR